jgi:hypothetical protein
MKKNIKIIITKNTSNNDSNINDSNNNTEIINSYIDDINNDIYKKDEKVIYNLQYFINILKYITIYIINKIQYIIKKYIILFFLILLILYFYIKYT